MYERSITNLSVQIIVVQLPLFPSIRLTAGRFQMFYKQRIKMQCQKGR